MSLSNELAEVATRILVNRQCADCGAPIHEWPAAVAHAESNGFACEEWLEVPALVRILRGLYFECNDCGGSECVCPGRVPWPEACQRIALHLQRFEPELFRLALDGEAIVCACTDGPDGWAWWVRLDKAAGHPQAGQEVYGTDYVYPEAR